MTKLTELRRLVRNSRSGVCIGCFFEHPSQTRHPCLTRSLCQSDALTVDFVDVMQPLPEDLKKSVLRMLRRAGERDYGPELYHHVHRRKQPCCDWVGPRLQKQKLRERRGKPTAGDIFFKKMINKKIKKYVKIWLAHPMYVVKKLNMYQPHPEFM